MTYQIRWRAGRATGSLTESFEDPGVANIVARNHFARLAVDHLGRQTPGTERIVAGKIEITEPRKAVRVWVEPAR
jgi:hypothetical protein